MDDLQQDVMSLINHYDGVYKVSDHGVKTMLDRWQANKGWILPTLGPDFRVEFELDATDQVYASSMDKFLNWRGEVLPWSRTACWGWGTDSIAEFVGFCVFYATQHLTAGVVANNLLTADHRFETAKMPPYQNDQLTLIVLRKGMKFGKALAAAILENADVLMPDIKGDETRQRIVEAVLIVLSRLTQKLQIKSKTMMVISANPVDILMASVHTAGNWQSCHSLHNGGYKAGPLAYAVDAGTLIAYTYQNKTIFEGFNQRTMPAKLWRMMIYVNPKTKAVVFSRQYPGAHVGYLDAAKKHTVEILAQAFGRSTEGNVMTDMSLSKAVKNGGIFAYRDRPSAGFRFGKSRATTVSMADAGLVCPDCGNDRTDITPGQMICPNCHLRQDREHQRRHA